MKNSDTEKEIKSNPDLEGEIRRRMESDGIPCAVVMELSGQFGESPIDLGRRLDSMKIHIIQCQLGLFGYKPVKIIVQPAAEVSPDLEKEIRQAMQDNYLPCIVAWAIARERSLSKMAVSSACEFLKIKIKPCQLGAF